ncbi:MAG TPA: molybdopterin-dependent oxidoreductase, partial [Solidesulfovibrio magneticus]|nr:molybdopterin-dependent oxidoreductase [Solidesulfovibrio magneticus]
AVAVVGGQRSTMETQAALTALARAAGWRAPAFFAAARQQAQARQALYALTPPRARSLADLAKADAVLVVGVSPLSDAPMLTLTLRQAARAGAAIFLADPRPLALPLDHVHLPLAPGQLAAVLAVAAAGEDASGLIQQQFPLTPELWPRLEALAQAMTKAKRPTIVYVPALAGSLPGDDRFGLFPVLAQAGTAGAALLAPTDAPGLDELAAEVAAGRIKAVIAVETDLFAAAPALAAQLAALEALVVLDHLPT